MTIHTGIMYARIRRQEVVGVVLLVLGICGGTIARAVLFSKV